MARRAGGGKGADLSTLEVWDGHLARAGAELTAFRIQLVASLQPLVAAAYGQLAPGGGDTVLEYRSSFEGGLPTSREQAEEQLLNALQAVRKQEVDRGITLVGPHRDELVLSLGPLPAKGYASHGESWSFALALRLASYELLRADGGEPVLILDDVFAELDAARRDRLAELVAGGEQVLVTAAVAEDVPKTLAGARFAVSGGAVRRIDA